MSRVTRRFDGELAKPERTPEGWLRVEGRLARVGTQRYVNADGSERIELRLPEEVFAPESMAAFAQIPLTNRHPAEMLDARNATRHAVGSVGAPRQDGDWLVAPMVVWDGGTVAEVDRGLKQLSTGYSCILDATQDPALAAKWGRYDSIQRGIRPNHQALVDQARAGEGASLRLDSAGNAVLASESDAPQPLHLEPKPMPKIVRIDGITLTTGDDNADAIQQAHDRAIASERTKAEQATAAEKQRADVAERGRADALTLVKTLETERDTIRADRDANKKRADEGEQAMVKCAKDGCNAGKMTDGSECPDCMGKGEKPKMDAAGKVRAWVDNAIAKGVTSRAALMDAARPHLPAEWKADGKSDLDVKRAVVANLDGRDMAAEPAAYVERRYSIAIEEAAKREDGKPRPIDGARPALPIAPPVDGKRADNRTPEEKQRHRLTEIHKQDAAQSAK